MARYARLANDPVYANGAALVLNSFAASALGFAFWLVAARRFSAESLGFGAAVVSAATLAALVGKAGFDAAVIRFGPSASPRALARLVAYALGAAVLLTAAVVAVVLALAGGGVASLAPLRSPLAATGFALLACGTSAAWILDAFFIAEQRAVYTLARNLAFNVVKLGAPFVVVLALADYAVPLAWGAGLAASLVVALLLVPRAMALRPAPGAALAPTRRGAVAAYAAKNYVLNVAEFLPGLILPILVLETLGPVTTARFFLAWTIAAVGFLASKAIAQSAFAALVREGPTRDAVRKAARLSLLVLAPLGAALFVGAPWLLRLFGAGYDVGSAELLRVLALSLPGVVVVNVYLAYLKARQAGWELTLLPAATLVSFLVLVPAALANGGIIGVGLAWLGVQLASGAYAGVRLIVILRRSTHSVPALGRRAHEG